MTAEQLTLDLWATPEAPDDETVIAEITALAEQSGAIATATHVLGGLDFYVSPHKGGPCAFATPAAARELLVSWNTRTPQNA